VWSQAAFVGEQSEVATAKMSSPEREDEPCRPKLNAKLANFQPELFHPKTPLESGHQFARRKAAWSSVTSKGLAGSDGRATVLPARTCSETGNLSDSTSLPVTFRLTHTLYPSSISSS
jgi:hypothetical protein